MMTLIFSEPRFGVIEPSSAVLKMGSSFDLSTTKKTFPNPYLFFLKHLMESLLIIPVEKASAMFVPLATTEPTSICCGGSQKLEQQAAFIRKLPAMEN
ncbi:MAG: hypothetical protein WCA08_07975, partial [Desulfoferrobacter sp.]